MKVSHKIAPVALAITLTTACTKAEDKERSYDIPDSLCGIRLDANLSSPIFPPGEQLEVFDYFPEDSGTLSPVGRCDISVDESPAIYIHATAVLPDMGGRPGVSDYLTTYADQSRNQGTYSTVDAKQISENPHEAWVWPDFAATSILCEGSSFASAVNISIRLDWAGEDDDLSKSLGDLIEPLATDFVRQVGEHTCAPKALPVPLMPRAERSNSSP